jgi:hypothetical protein
MAMQRATTMSDEYPIYLRLGLTGWDIQAASCQPASLRALFAAHIMQ